MSGRSFLLHSKPGDVWMVVRACAEHKRTPNYEGVPFDRKAGEVQPCMNGCIYETVSLVNDPGMEGL
jgi:hypothetical protein